MDNPGFTPLFELLPGFKECCFRPDRPFRDPGEDSFGAYPSFSAEFPLFGESGASGCAFRPHRIP
jgi:hypothetical protein